MQTVENAIRLHSNVPTDCLLAEIRLIGKLSLSKDLEDKKMAFLRRALLYAAVNTLSGDTKAFQHSLIEEFKQGKNAGDEAWILMKLDTANNVVLFDALNGSNAGMRLAAVVALENSMEKLNPNQKQLEQLAAALDDESQSVRMFSAMALQKTRMPAERHLELFLVRLEKEKDSVVRQMLIRAVASVPMERAKLKERLEKASAENRGESFDKALQEIIKSIME